MPHEVDITKALIMSLDEWHTEQEDNQVIASVILQVGEFTCVEPDLLLSSFALQRTSKPWLESAELVIKAIPLWHTAKTATRTINHRSASSTRAQAVQRPCIIFVLGRELKIEAIELLEEKIYVQ